MSFCNWEGKEICTDIFCLDCACNRDGTTDEVCDFKSGCCKCKEGVTGELCQFCEPGKFHFPHCKGTNST